MPVVCSWVTTTHWPRAGPCPERSPGRRPCSERGSRPVRRRRSQRRRSVRRRVSRHRPRARRALARGRAGCSPASWCRRARSGVARPVAMARSTREWACSRLLPGPAGLCRCAPRAGRRRARALGLRERLGAERSAQGRCVGQVEPPQPPRPIRRSRSAVRGRVIGRPGGGRRRSCRRRGSPVVPSASGVPSRPGSPGRRSWRCRGRSLPRRSRRGRCWRRR